MSATRRLRPAAVLLLALTAVPAVAEGPTERPPAEPKAVVLETADGLKLSADLYEPEGGGEGKAAILALHDAGGSRECWKALGQRLAGKGISLLAPDLRGHGKSREAGGTDLGPQAEARDPALWKAMAADVQAGLKYLRGTLLADAKRIGIAGAGAGAGLAFEAAEKDTKVRAVFGVAPSPAACGLAGLAAAVRWDGRPAGFVVGAADEKGDAAPLAKELRKHPRSEIVVLPREAKAAPADLLAEARSVDETAQFFLGWFDRPVLTGKPEEGVQRGGGIFVSGSGSGFGQEAGGLRVHGYQAPGKISGLVVLADPDPASKRVTESSRRITLVPGPTGKAVSMTVVVESWTGKAWKKGKPFPLSECGGFVTEGATAFYDIWLSPGLLGVPPFNKVALEVAPVVDGATKWPDRPGFGTRGGSTGFSPGNPSSWQSWDLR